MNKISKDVALSFCEILKQQNRLEKHINYHVLPEQINSALLGTVFENKYIHCEPQRLDYFLNNLNLEGKTVLDIGCNLGYFLFGFLDAGAKKVVGYEGKISCANFIEKAIDALGEKNRFEFHNKYVEFDDFSEKFDIILLLNVLHHLGDDFGDQSVPVETAKQLMLMHLNKLSHYASQLVFQLGFNWRGDRNRCLFSQGTKSELIGFITEGVKEFWEVEAIGVAEHRGGIFSYQPLSAKNISRDDSLGEFMNRPVFILKSKII